MSYTSKGAAENSSCTNEQWRVTTKLVLWTVHWQASISISDLAGWCQYLAVRFSLSSRYFFHMKYWGNENTKVLVFWQTQFTSGKMHTLWSNTSVCLIVSVRTDGALSLHRCLYNGLWLYFCLSTKCYAKSKTL